MNAMWIIFRRELKARVGTKAFIISTLLFPTIMGAIIFLSVTMARGSGHRTFALVNEAPAEIADRFADALQGANGDRDSKTNRYSIERVSGTFANNEAALNARVLNKKIDGYVFLPAEILTSNRIVYCARNISSLEVSKDLQFAVDRAVQAQRLGESGIEPDKLAAIIKPVQIDSGQVTKDKVGTGSAAASFAVAYAVAFLIYFTTITQGIGLLRSVLEEKTNRISEVMMSSARPGFMMAGKIMGAGSAAILQVASWIVILIVAAVVLSQGIIPTEITGALNIDPWTALALVLFFVLGFFLYASMYAAMGSMVNSEQEAQSIQSLGILPLVVPMVFMARIIDDPLGPIANWLSMIPFTSPLTMPLRMASETIPPAQIFASLIVLAAGMVAVMWIAGRIYRIGILSTGKKPNISELIKWIKAS